MSNYILYGYLYIFLFFQLFCFLLVCVTNGFTNGWGRSRGRGKDPKELIHELWLDSWNSVVACPLQLDALHGALLLASWGSCQTYLKMCSKWSSVLWIGCIRRQNDHHDSVSCVMFWVICGAKLYGVVLPINNNHFSSEELLTSFSNRLAFYKKL